MNDAPDTEAVNIERRERLGRGTSAHIYNPTYSKFIRRMRLILPMVALALVAIVFAWGNMSDENIVPVKDAKNAPQTIGKNELLNPKFESMDDKKQPYTITAKRAVQAKEGENTVILESPTADMLLNSGNWIAIKAIEGAYKQDDRTLLLEGDVKLFHDNGYEMEMAKLNIDLNSNKAWSDTEVKGHGPAGTLVAKGLQADSNSGSLIFNGPATLVLVNGEDSLDLGKMAP
jgi:lipopolysaccharide export system protein LptC